MTEIPYRSDFRTARRMIGIALPTMVIAAFASQLLPSRVLSGQECLWVEHFDTARLERGTMSGTLTEGRIGKGLLLKSPGDFARFDTKGRLTLNEGTVALWVKLNWNVSDRADLPHYTPLGALFSMLGSPPHWNALGVGLQKQQASVHLVADFVKAKESVPDIWKADCLIDADIGGWKKGEWHRITLTWKNVNSEDSNGLFTLYIDGEKVAQRRDRITITEMGKQIYFGASARSEGKADTLDGVIDEIATYNYAISDEEVSRGRASETLSARRSTSISNVEQSANRIETRLPIMTIMKTPSPPTIDGEIEDHEWKYATMTSGFVDLLHGQLSENDVDLYVMYDDENLYIAFRSVIPGRPKADVRGAGNSEVCNDDAVEVLLLPDPTHPERLYQFIGNSIGAIFSSMGPLDRAKMPQGNCRFDNKVKDSGETHGGVLTFGKSVWTAEVALPFRDLQVDPPKDGDSWRANFCRDLNAANIKRNRDPNRRWTSWSPPVNGAFRHRDGLGYVYFREKAPVIKCAFRGDLLREGNILVKGALFNPCAHTWNLYNRISLRDVESAMGLIDRKIPIVLVPSGERTLDTHEETELTSAVPMQFLCSVGDYTQDVVLYQRTFGFISSPSFSVRSVLLYSRGVVEIQCDFKNVSQLTGNATATAAIHRADDDEPVSSLPMQGFSKTHPTGTIAFPIADMAPGNYLVRAEINDRGSVLARGSDLFTVPARPEWWGNQLGVSEEVPAPWTPVQVSGNTVAVWGRQFHFTEQPFPAGIETKGKSILASPIRLELETSRGPVQWSESRFSVVSKNDSLVKLETINKSPTVDLLAEMTVEFDGFLRVDFKLVPREPTVLKDLTLRIPMRAENALYAKALSVSRWPGNDFGWYAACLYEGAEGKNGSTLDVNKHWHYSAKGWIWPNRFMHYVWVGNGDLGLSVAFDSDRNWHTKQYVEITETPAVKELQLHLIGFDRALKKPLDYSLGLHATPAKPLPNDPKNWRYGWRGAQTPDGLEDMAIVCQYGLTRGVGWPELTAKGKSLVERFNRAGVKLTPDYATNVTSFEMPEFQTFGREWEVLPIQSWGAEGGPAIVVSLKGSYTDFFLWGLNRLIDGGLKGIYLDSGGTVASVNQYGGCGYVAGDGTVRPTINLFGAREGYKRLYTLFKTRVPDSFIFNHGVPMSPLASFVDAVTEGEEWTDFNVGDLTYLGPDYFRCGFMMYQAYGVPFCLYPGLPRGFPNEVSRDDLVPLVLSHNTWSIYTGDPLQVAAWSVMNDWYTNSRWIPYWENGRLVRSFTKDVKVSVYRKPDGESLLIVANLANTRNAGDVELNLAGFGLYDDYELTRLERDGSKMEMSLRDRSFLSVSLPRHDLAFFRLGKR